MGRCLARGPMTLGRLLGGQAVEKPHGEGVGRRRRGPGEGSGVQQSGVDARHHGGLKSSV